MSYNSDSPSDRLTAVRAAIARCLDSQGFTVRQRSLQMARLSDLRELEKELMQELSDSNSGGSMSSLSIETRPT